MILTGLYTDAGAAMAARAQAEGLSLVITRAAAGSGQTEAAATAMERERQALTIHIKEAREATVVMSAVLSASQATMMYTLSEVGLFARLGEEEEVLYKLFRLSETITVEPGSDLTATFFLTETMVPAEQVEITVSQQGMVSQGVCTQTAQAAAQVVREELESHAASGSAHSTLFAQKAPLSHTHAASAITAGTLGGVVAAAVNTAYATAQVRSIVLSDAEPSGGSNGQIWIKYTA